MKKLTKTQKQNLKKKMLRFFNIIGLIVGGLSFIVVLYAIIAGGLAANNSEDTTAEVSEVAPSKPILEQRALYPPANYEFSLGPYQAEEGFWYYNTFEGRTEALFEKVSNDYTTSYYWRDLLFELNIYEPSTTFEPRTSPMYAVSGEYIGSAAREYSGRFQFKLDNRNSAQAFLFYADFSSSAYDVSSLVWLYDINAVNIARLNDYTSFYNQSLRALYVPPYSLLDIIVGYTDSAQYLDRIYIDDIGSTAYDIGFDDGEYFGGEGGYDWGYEVGLEDGYDTGYSDGLDVGYTGGYEDGYFDASESNIPYTYVEGYEDGYSDGLADASESGGAIGNAFDLIYAGAASVDRILSINIFGSITLGMLLFTPLIIGIALAVIKIIKG